MIPVQSQTEEIEQQNNQEIKTEENKETQNSQIMYVCAEGQKYRDLSQIHAQEMKKFFQESQLAWKNNQKAEAKTLSNQGRQSERQMQDCNEMAAQIIFDTNNKDRPIEEIDLHGLYVKEALKFTAIRIKQLLEKQIYTLVVIVGKGLHSKDGKQKIAPGIQKYAEDCGITYEFNVPHEGCFKLNMESVKKDVQTTEEDFKDQKGMCLVM